MQRIDTVVIGAGQAGLATSRLLVESGRDHVVLERGRVAERWRSERWDSLRLLTPNWMTRLPHHAYDGPDPDGYMRATELADRLARYASGFDAPVREAVTVRAVRAADDGFAVATDDGTWLARDVVVATGWCGKPRVPACAEALDPAIEQLHAVAYRNPEQLPPGGVLVVGASASGVQIADELRRAGREVLLAAGTHTRIPRRYRGMDVLWWLDRLGMLDDRPEDVPEHARRQPSLQLVGRPADLDLPALAATGVRVTGRLTGVDGTAVTFADDLAATSADADRRLRRLLARIDAHVTEHGLDGEVLAGQAPAAARLPAGDDRVDLRRAGIRSVVWATGHRPHFPWLHVPVLDEHGAIRQRAGITAAAGLYVVGMRWQTRRSSTFIDGVGHDARVVVDHLVARAGSPVAA